MDLADIAAFLESPSPVIQSQGFSSLLENMRNMSKNEASRAETVEFLLSRLGSPCAGWVPYSVESLIAGGFLDREDFCAECIRRLSKSSTPVQIKGVLVGTLLSLAKDGVDFLSFCVHVVNTLDPFDQVLLLPHLKHLDSKRFTSVVVALVHHEKIGFAFRTALFNYATTIWTPETLKSVLPALKSGISSEFLFKAAEYDSTLTELILQNTHLYSVGDLRNGLKLRNEHAFHLYEALSRSPPQAAFALLRNKQFPAHPAIFPSLLVLAASVREYSTKPSVGFSLPTEDQQFLRSLIATIQKSFASFYKKKSPNDDVADLHNFLLWICEDSRRIAELLCIWSVQKNKECFNGFTSASMLAALGAVVGGEQLATYLDVLVNFINDTPDLANDFIVFCMTLYATTPPAEEKRRSALLKCLVRLTVHPMTIAPVLKFLLAMCQQRKSTEMLALLGDLFERHERIFSNILPLLSLGPSDESFLWNRAKMDVIRRVCRVSDKCEDFLETLSTILNQPESPFFVDAIGALADMCRQEIIDFEVINKQIRKKYDVSDEAVVAYIDLLSTAATNSEKASVWSSAFAELWNRVHDGRVEVAAAAWKALANFDLSVFLPEGECYKEEFDLSGPKLLEMFSTMQDRKEREAFVVFCRKLLQIEVESYSRTLYTKTSGDHHDPFSGTIRFLREAINDDPFFKLGLISPLCVNINSSASRVERILQIFTDGLLKNERKVCDDFGRTMQYYAIWKNAVQACFDVQMETNTLGSEYGEEEQNSQERFLLSSLEFLMNATSFKYKLVGPPIFRFFEKETVRRSAVITSFSGISALILLNWMPSELIISHFGQTKRDLIEFVSQNCPRSEWIRSSLVDMLLFNQTVESEELKSLSAFDVRVCGYVVGAAPVMIDMVAASAGAVPTHRTESVLGAEHIGEAFDRFLALDDARQRKAFPQFAKKIEKLCRNDKSVHATVMDGLVKHYIGLSSQDASMMSGYETALPDASLLKAMINTIRESEDVEKTTVLGRVLVDQKRTDGRRLPPIDWSFLLNEDYEHYKDISEFYSVLFRIAAPEKAAKLLCKLSSKELLHLVKNDILAAETIAANIEYCNGVIPNANLSSLVQHVFLTCGKIGWNAPRCKTIAEQITWFAGRDKMMRQLLSAYLPKIGSMSDLIDSVSLFKELAAVKGLQAANGCMVTEFWILVKSGRKLDVDLIYETLQTMSDDHRRTCLLIYAWCTGTNPNKRDLISTAFDLISAKLDEQNVSVFWTLFLTLAVSVHTVPFPVTLYSAGDSHALETLQKFAMKYFEKFLLVLSEEDAGSKATARFLIHVLNTSVHASQSDCFVVDRSDVKHCLKTCINNNPASIRTIMDAELLEELFD
ncbi:hypothetical protein QR680_009417 [Steinernema hermaphroditum]|uniref:DUF3730 domain-containing protein n=1 Tax=Steinernema hermaphroditum TaxID=289476 RepID=A0AA39ILF2_9BILA|nr:hypothetical protein QR680_009417 [Steinernema hermaphroditum]